MFQLSAKSRVILGYMKGMMKTAIALAVFLCIAIAANPSWADPANLTLDQALRIAVTNHPLLAQGRAGVEIQQGVETETRAPELPSINYASTYQRANTRGSAFGASAVFTVYTSIFSLNQLLYDFGRTPELVRASHEQVIAARETLRSNLEQVLLGVHQAYYQLLQAKANVKVQQDNVSNLQNHLAQAKSFFEVGTQPKINVTQAESNLSTGQLTLVQAENTFAISQTNLKAAMGAPDFQPFQVTQELQAPPEYSISLDEAVKQAYEHRPDLLALLAQQLGTQAGLSAARKAFFPTFTGSASSGQIGPTYYPNQNTWNLGVQFNLSIFNGLLTTGQIEQAEGNLHQLQAQVDNEKLTVRQGVEQAYDNLVADKASLKVAQDSLSYAKENYELANGRYQTGVGNYLEYTDAQVSYVQAQSNLIAALGNYNIAVAALKQAMGTLEGP